MLPQPYLCDKHIPSYNYNTLISIIVIHLALNQVCEPRPIVTLTSLMLLPKYGRLPQPGSYLMEIACVIIYIHG